jgi:uncharacterized protein
MAVTLATNGGCILLTDTKSIADSVSIDCTNTEKFTAHFARL